MYGTVAVVCFAVKIVAFQSAAHIGLLLVRRSPAGVGKEGGKVKS